MAEIDPKQARRTKHKKSHEQGTHTNRKSWRPVQNMEEKDVLTTIVIYDSLLDEVKEYNIPEKSKFNQLWGTNQKKSIQAIEGLLNQLIARHEALRAEPVVEANENDDVPEKQRLWIKVTPHVSPDKYMNWRCRGLKPNYWAQYAYDGKSVRANDNNYYGGFPSEEDIWLIVHLHFDNNFEKVQQFDKDTYSRGKIDVMGKVRAERRSLQSNDGKSRYAKGYDAYDFSSVRFRDCFHGKGLVLMKNGLQKRVEDIRAGDIVATPEGTSSVECTVKSVVKSCHFCDIDGCLLTPGHPVFTQGSWKIPKSISSTFELDVDAVYNFVLESGHCVFINGVECITLGHDHEVHDFSLPSKFQGTKEYLDFLRKHEDFPNIIKICENKPSATMR